MCLEAFRLPETCKVNSGLDVFKNNVELKFGSEQTEPLTYHHNNFLWPKPTYWDLNTPNYVISTSKDNVELFEKIDV